MGFVAALFAVFLGAVPASGEAGEPPADRAWRDGPARFLLSDSEYERYGRLETDESRAAFVQRFWHRLDPDPATLENEFRERFSTRCIEAETRFSERGRSGWRTDRGRVYLALGEPDTIERLPGDPESIGRELWTYTTRASGDPLRIVFYRGTDGIFRLDPAGGNRPDPFDPSVRRALVERIRDTNPGLGRIRTAGIVNGYLVGVFGEDGTGRSDVRWSERRGLARPDPAGEAATQEASATGRLLEEVYYFQAADGSVVALLTLEVATSPRLPSETDRPPYSAVAYVSAPADVAIGGAQRAVVLSAFPGSEASGREIFVGRVYLEPGTSQRIRYAVTDATRSTLLLRTATLHAPEFGTGRLSTSSLVPAERFGPAPADGSLFAVGSEEVVPRPSATFGRGEPLRFYLQVYDASVHARTYRYDVNLSFEFFRRNGRRFKKHGKTLHVRGAYGASLGLALPIGDWPVGEYRVDVIVEDMLSRIRSGTDATFFVTD